LIHTQATREAEEDEENNVDLQKTMWFIIRKKQSINQVLKEFYSESQQQRLRVRDIIKFGRVNFKITEIKCDHIDREFTGTCHSTNLSTMLFEKKGKKANVAPLKKSDSINS
jgi:hypothetical protein